VRQKGMGKERGIRIWMPLYSVLLCFDNRVEENTDWTSRSSVVLCFDERGDEEGK
jgi:hypothetical protein